MAEYDASWNADDRPGADRHDEVAQVLKTLASPPNRRILVTLADQPAHGRDLAGRLALPETEVSRRLRAMERLGIVDGRWVYEGRNVKKYRPAAWAFQFRLDGDGIHVSAGAPWAEACTCGRAASALDATG